MGTPDFAVLPLKYLVENNYNVVAVVCNHDKPVGRKQILTAPPVKTFAIEKNIPAVLCATGYSQSDLEKIDNASKKTAIFRSANMSVGVNLLVTLVKSASLALNGFDIEITEMHHNKKVDAPSGTALMLAEAITSVLPEKFFLYGREGKVGARNPKEIGIHAIRGGNIVGEHDVIFAGNSETITLSHQATDRAVFASGAVKAAEYIAKKSAGLYDMSDVINGK